MAHPPIFPLIDEPLRGPFILANGVKVFSQDFQVNSGVLE